MTTLVFDSDDVGETEEFLNEAYSRMRIGGSAESTHARMTRDANGMLSIDELEFGYEMSYAVDPLGKICLCTIQSGTIEDLVTGGIKDSFGPGDVFSLASPDQPFAGRLRRARYNITMFDPLALTQVATTAPGRTPEPVRLTGHRPVSAAAGRHLLSTITHLRDNVLADPIISRMPLIISTSTQQLAASVLATFPNNTLADPSAKDRHDARPDALRRAIAFVDGHADTPINAADIAVAARVTIRTLQYAFRRHLGTTPMNYLRQVRMAAAHADLAGADPASTTVTIVAAHWGFFHSGRFAATYKAAYGRPPGETLRG